MYTVGAGSDKNKIEAALEKPLVACLHAFLRHSLNSALRFPSSVKSSMEQVSISDYEVKRISGQHHSSFILHCTTDLKETGVFIHICTSMFTL